MVLGALSEPELGEEPGSGTVIREPERFSGFTRGRLCFHHTCIIRLTPKKKCMKKEVQRMPFHSVNINRMGKHTITAV
jgi:hypothetical protein